MSAGHGDETLAHRRAFLTQANADSMFRDQLVGVSQGIYVTLTVIVAIGIALLAWTNRYRRLLRFGALGVLGFPTVTYLTAPFHFATNGGRFAFWVFVAVASLAFVLLCEVIGRRATLGPLICGLALVVALHLMDAFTGLHLEFNTPFGYAPTVGIRIAGIGNQTFAQLAAGAVVLAGLIATTRRINGSRPAIVLLGVTLVAMIPPSSGRASVRPSPRLPHSWSSPGCSPDATSEPATSLRSRCCSYRAGSWSASSTCCAPRANAPT